ncbi:MAG: hypothetical protein FWE85_00120 [Clostridiales bacterium]|nr:hypothetical protein [Clostridiales bacterium]
MKMRKLSLILIVLFLSVFIVLAAGCKVDGPPAAGEQPEIEGKTQTESPEESPGENPKDNPGAGGILPGLAIEFGGIDWLVLDVQGGKALVISEKILETHRPYNEKESGGDMSSP